MLLRRFGQCDRNPALGTRSMQRSWELVGGKLGRRQGQCGVRGPRSRPSLVLPDLARITMAPWEAPGDKPSEGARTKQTDAQRQNDQRQHRGIALTAVHLPLVKT